MTFEQLPKRLQVEGVQLVDPTKKEKVVIKLSDATMNELERIYKPILDREQQGA